MKNDITATKGATESNLYKECVLDPVAWIIKSILISVLTQTMLDWVNSGFLGGPVFLRDPLEFAKGLAYEAFNAFLDESGVGDYLCEPFSADVVTTIMTLSTQSTYGPSGNVSCTLDDIVGRGVAGAGDTIYREMVEQGSVENGGIVIKPALSDTEFIEFEDVGTLEAFNTDGLRSLIKTMNIPNMKEKTLRYPGYIDQIKLLKDYGFFQTDEVNIDGKQIRPIDLTSKLLISKWKLEDDEPEFTVMKIIISGIENNKKVKYIYELFDKFDAETQTSSMARTTGYSCTSAVELVLNGDYTEKGLFPPEFLGAKNDCLKKMLAYQEDRNIVYKISKT